ncbi:HAMP domain-containing protein [Tessaracoccus sp. OS52]|uniref:sensor histidine kinase n=1 Tax=Tessaracoccus sp. OS52 TaxID=2886691 RepID=UPI001D0FB89C|nr:ATP-binding protein [Tessaracoccus sp. OS52]MCC2592498.1 HAMP domain-containing protein [Tessaracoccus sp. OS52]
MRRPGEFVGSLRWGTRTFLTQALVVTASVITAALVAVVVGPPLFHEHLLKLGHSGGSAEMAHVEEAFLDAGVRSLGMGLVVALTLALGLAWLETRRLQLPLEQLTAAASLLEAGDYSARVAAGGTSPEFEALGKAFNDMAGRLDSTEESRRRLLSDVAHELRTPLATLTAELEALADGVIPWDEDSENLLALQAARLQKVALDLHDVSRAEEGRFSLDTQPLSVAELADHAVASFEARFVSKGVDLESDSDGSIVAADPQRVGQILGNLLDNALRHTPPGGHVRIEAREAREDAVITVRDSGDGLFADQLVRVFDRFYRADTARARDAGGSGIGLTISRSLALAHGGSLTASSPGPGRGSTFTLHLPRVSEPGRFLTES